LKADIKALITITNKDWKNVEGTSMEKYIEGNKAA